MLGRCRGHHVLVEEHAIRTRKGPRSVQDRVLLEKERGNMKIAVLGNIGGNSPFVNEVVDFLIEHRIEGVQGN